MKYQKNRRRSIRNRRGLCTRATQSAAQVVPTVEDYHITRRNEAAYWANMKLNWPEAYAYDMATLTGDWMDYEEEYPDEVMDY